MTLNQPASRIAERSARAGLWRGVVPCVRSRRRLLRRAENFCSRQAGGYAVSDRSIFGQLRGTGLETEIEPLAHGLATILQRRNVVLSKEGYRTADRIGALAQSHDGSEIAETAIEEAQARFLHLR